MRISRRCKYCNAPMNPDPTMTSCPDCGQQNFPGSLSDSKTETIVMAKVREQKKLEPRPRIPIGIFGDPVGEVGDEDFKPGIYGRDEQTGTWGLPDTAMVMVGGRPGCGKTTKFLMMCEMVLDYYPGEKDEALYITNEQSNDELEGYGARLHLRHMDRIRLYNAMGEGLKRPFEEIVAEYRPRIMVLDSLSNLLDTHGMSDEEGIKVANAIKDLSVKYRFPSMIVMQINKQGEMKGRNDVIHKGDIILNMDSDDVTGKRILYSSKNRFGEAPVERWLRMQATGEENPGRLVMWED